jgi:hypothetical protein
MPAARVAKSGTRGKIHDWWYQGRIASLVSHRRTVEAEMSSTTPLSTASSARSAWLKRDRGTLRVAGSSQAIALTWACCARVNLGGRPGRSRSRNPASPAAAKRPRQVRTVSSQTPTRSAIAVLGQPRAASSTIVARTTWRCSAVAVRVSFFSRWRWTAVSTTGQARLAIMGSPHQGR